MGGTKQSVLSWQVGCPSESGQFPLHPDLVLGLEVLSLETGVLVSITVSIFE
jgi:hypothetical protein